MDFVNDLSGGDRPLLNGAMLSPLAFSDYGSSSPNRLPSVRSTSTDSSNDPDGPAMNNGNGNCHTPDFDDSMYDDHALGTPNSFIGDLPQSPSMFSGHRQRLMSTSSSTFTYSPYSPYSESQIPPAFTPAYERQTSLAMVEEVLGTTEECQQPGSLFPKDESPAFEESEDSCLPPYPSPSFIEHFNANNKEAENFITSSQDEEFYATFSGTDGPSGYQCDGSPTTEPNQKSTSNCNNNNCSDNDTPSSGTQETSTTCAEETTVADYIVPLDVVSSSAMERQDTRLSDIITDSYPTNSLDVNEMMNDFMTETLIPGQNQYTTLNVEVLSEDKNSDSSSNNEQMPLEQPGTSASTHSERRVLDENCNSFAQTRPNDTDITAVRRERNNAACRQSRKRRKEKKQELENQAVFFTEENEALKAKIEELEVECKRMKASILSTMTNNAAR